MASEDRIPQHARDLSPASIPALLELLSNTLVLRQTVPYLPIASLFNLASTCRFLHNLIHQTPGVFRHLDLTRAKSAHFVDVPGIDHGGQVWRNAQLDENLTEDDFYSGPLRGIFHSIRRRNILQDVHTLVLDGLSVTAEFVNDILVDPSYRVRVLSIRGVKNLNERKLMQSLRYVCRPTRPEGTPHLKGLYVFGARDGGASSQPQDGDDWYQRKGRLFRRKPAQEWADTLLDCRGVIQFDATLCTSPRHQNSPAYGRTPVSSARPAVARQWCVATFALGGCASCGSAPEGLTTYGETPAADLPLLSPVPLQSSSVKAAICPSSPAGSDGSGKAQFVPRCLDCIRERCCFTCDQWWCESCYELTGSEVVAPAVQIVTELNDDMAVDGLTDDLEQLAAFEQPKAKTPKVTRSCWECESSCFDCSANTHKYCMACNNSYCIVHYEGSTATLCDWCSAKRAHRRRFRELY
ncbi:hypothetical protein F5Y15DRAFT_339675 [Xylariaceae sp. FL0016]|nr:hypothetical protein F5Y15DRAFT_339675 [Xylariaceae sp. FL0016]